MEFYAHRFLDYLRAKQIKVRSYLRKGKAVKGYTREIQGGREITIEEAVSYDPSAPMIPSWGVAASWDARIRSLWLLPEGKLLQVSDHFESLMGEEIKDSSKWEAFNKAAKASNLVRMLITLDEVDVETFRPTLTESQKIVLRSIRIRTRGKRDFVWASGSAEWRRDWEAFAKKYGL
jgi:hypothetical protein